jgi:DeoR/GlpR family transcriptional regulator of sugar metabolism
MNTERISKISRLIESQGRVTLTELSRIFKDVSQMTLRRDLIFLENAGEIIRVKNGAVSAAKKEIEGYFYQRAETNAAEKKIIAEKAVTLIEEGKATYIDSGSTSLYFVRQLPDLNYCIITNGINIALELSNKTLPSVTVLGGTLSRNNTATSGIAGYFQLQNLNIDTAFLCTSAFSEESGFTCGNPTENEIKKLALSKAKRKIILMDSSKAGNIMPYTFAHLKDIDILVSDGKLPVGIKSEALKTGVKIL